MSGENMYRHFNEDFTLQGKNAIITGAASGIGLEIAKMYARKGANLALFDLHAPDEASLYAQEQGVRCIRFAGDITDSAVIADIVAQAVKEFGRIDVLVNCAGIGMLEMAAESTERVWDMTLAVNLTGAVHMAQAVYGNMKENGGGCIINIASQGGVVALEKHLAYGTAKAGLIHATKQFALEWGKFGIRTNAISPTVILTPMGEMNWNNEQGEALKQTIPLKRFGYPEEVAACAVYLASDAARLFNGANLVLDGGYTIA